MAKPTPEAYFADYFAKNPKATVEEANAAYDAEPEDDRTFVGRAADAVVPLALRVVPAIGGAVLGSAMPGAGTLIGGAGGAGLGETAAEGYETWRGLRKEINPAQVLLQATLGAVPMGKAKVLLPEAQVVRQALKGGVMGGTSTGLTQAFEGQPVDPVEVAKGVLLGTAFGGAAGKLTARKIPQLETDIPRLAQLEDQRLTASHTVEPNVVERAKAIPRKVTRKLVNQFEPVDRFVREGEKERGIRLLPSHDPSVKNDLVFGGTGGRVQNAFEDFKGIQQEAERAGLGDALRRYLDLNFMEHGAQNLENQGAKAALADELKLGVTDAPTANPTPLGTSGRNIRTANPTLGGKETAAERSAEDIFTNVREGKALPVGYTPPKIAEDLAKLEEQLGPEHFPKVQALGEKVFQLNRASLDRVTKEGIVSPETYQELTSRKGNYGPLERVMDERSDEMFKDRTAGLSLAQQKTIYRLRGSMRTTKDPFEASMNRAQQAIQDAGRNEAARTLVDLRKMGGFWGENILPHEGGEVPRGMGLVHVYEGGQKKAYAVPQEVAMAMNLADPPEVQMVGKATLGFFRSTLQTLATGANLGFAIPNVIKDVGDTAALSKSIRGPISFGKWAKAYAESVKSTITHDPEYRKFLEARAGFSTLQKNIDPTAFLGGEQRGVVGRAVHSVIDPIAQINSVLEENTKLTTFKRLKATGLTDDAAAIETRRFGGSPDFAKRGTASPEANLMFMFFNASVQGIARNARLVKDPKRFAALAGAATLAALATNKHNSEFVDPDGSPAMDKVSDADRKNNFIWMRPETYKTSDGVVRHKYWKIPKGHTLQLIFNPIEEAVNPSRSVAQTAANVASSLSPINMQLDAKHPVRSALESGVASLNPALRAPLEQFMGEGGRDTFRGTPIVPGRLVDVAPNFQTDKGTSPSITAATQALNAKLGPEWGRLSPKRIEAALRTGLLVGPGEMALDSIDSLVKPVKARQLEGDEATGKTPLVGTVLKRFVGSPVDQSEVNTFTDFYDLLGKAEEATQTFSRLKKDDPAKAKEYATANLQLLAGAKVLRRLSKGFASIRAGRAAKPELAESLGVQERKLLAAAREVMKKIQP